MKTLTESSNSIKTGNCCNWIHLPWEKAVISSNRITTIWWTTSDYFNQTPTTCWRSSNFSNRTVLKVIILNLLNRLIYSFSCKLNVTIFIIKDIIVAHVKLNMRLNTKLNVFFVGIKCWWCWEAYRPSIW